MDLSRTRRAILAGIARRGDITVYNHTDQVLTVLDTVYEDAEESLEDQVRIKQSITTDDVRGFVERSVEHLTTALLDLADTASLLKIIIEHDKDGFENALNSLRKQLDEERADREKWATIGEDLGDLDDHPF